jgi:non-structural maintenance of chromosomes element 1
MLAPNEVYSVSSFAALREVNALKTNMTKTQAEVVLGSFVAKGWLLKSRSAFLHIFELSSPVYVWFFRRGRYSLSTRTILELYKYLKETFGDEYILECTICMEVSHPEI